MFGVYTGKTKEKMKLVAKDYIIIFGAPTLYSVLFYIFIPYSSKFFIIIGIWFMLVAMSYGLITYLKEHKHQQKQNLIDKTEMPRGKYE